MKNRSVLIVEDDEIFSCLYQHSIRAFDQEAEVTIASDGYKALTMIANSLPDVVLLDIGMPSLDGCEFLRIVKSKSDYAELPIVVITSTPDFYGYDINAYPNTYLFGKPIATKLLHTILANILLRAPATESEATEKAHLNRYMGLDPSAQEELVKLFYETAPDRIVELHRLLKLGNVGLMKDWCHGMKGTASLLGAKDLQLQVEILNKTLDEATQPDITQQVNMIINTIRTVAVELNKLFTKGIKQHMNRP